MHFSSDELRHVFDPVTLSRGQKYARAGRVEALNVLPSGGLISAVVRGSRAKPYRCVVNLDRNSRGKLQVKGQCTCPMRYNCKHVVATLLKVATAQSGAPPATASLDYLSDAWLRAVEAARDPAGGYPPEVNERLLYVLSRHVWPVGTVRPCVNLVKARVLKDGAFGQSYGFQLNPASNARFVRPADTAIMRQLHAMRVSGGIELEGRPGAQVLRAMIETGRAYWQEIGGVPLHLAAPRPGRLVWREDDAGRLRLDAEARGAVALPLTPPWYVDPGSGDCGPLDTGLNETLAGALLAGPALGPEALEQALPRLAALVPEKLPQPARMRVIRRDDIVPVPRLVLGSAALHAGRPRRGGGSTGERLDYATLRFDYAGLLADPSGPDAALRQRVGEELFLITRDEKAEQHAIGQLLEMGFAALSPMAGVPSGSLHQRHGMHGWLDFLAVGVQQLRDAGWQVTIEPDFHLRVVEADDWQADIQEGEDWFSIGLGIEVEGQRIELLPVLARLIRTLPDVFEAGRWQNETRDVLVALDEGRFLRLPAQRVGPIVDTLAELFDPGAVDKQGRMRLSRLAAPQVVDLAGAQSWHWNGGEKLKDFAQRLKDFSGIARARPPKGFRAELRPYQQHGLDWLQFLRAYGLSGVLADDMGLGKTVQTLAHLLLEKQSGRMDRPSLVVAPTSLVHNWRREAEQFAPALKVLVLHGTARKARFDGIGDHDLVITTYPLLARDEDVLRAQPYHLLILDEAQNIKNPRAKAAEIVRELSARHRLCLTGTPMENHLGELWSLFHFLMPGLLGDEMRFKRLFRTPIEKHDDEARRRLLASRIKPFLLRRTKQQVATELPPKTEIVRSAALEGAQRDLYETVRAAMHEKVRAEVEKKGLDRSRIVILDALLKLRQCCCDPRLLKLDAAKKVRQSAKLELLMGMLPELVEEGRRILLFSQFTSMLALIEKALDAQGLEYVKLTGDTRDRATPIDRFQSGQVPIFLISLKAGGTGLNLTAADTVIHYDPWWNPAVEAQATDRAYRIGQDKPVFVYKLLTEHTIEEKIAALQAHKKELAEALLGEGKGKLKLAAEDLAALFEPLG